MLPRSCVGVSVASKMFMWVNPVSGVHRQVFVKPVKYVCWLVRGLGFLAQHVCFMFLDYCPSSMQAPLWAAFGFLSVIKHFFRINLRDKS